MVLNQYSIKEKEFIINGVYFLKIFLEHESQSNKNLILLVHAKELDVKEEIGLNKKIELINKDLYPNILVVHQAFVPPKGNIGDDLFEIPEVLNILITVSNFKEDEIQILSLLSLFLLKEKRLSFVLKDIEEVRNCSRKEFSYQEILAIITECPFIVSQGESYTLVDFNFANYFAVQEFNQFEKTNYIGAYPPIQNFSSITGVLLNKLNRPIEFERRFEEYKKMKHEFEQLVFSQEYEKAANLRHHSLQFFNKNIVHYWTELNLNNWEYRAD